MHDECLHVCGRRAELGKLHSLVKGYDYMQCVNGLSVLWILPAGSGNWRQLDNDVWLSRHYQDINVTLSQWLCLCV